MGQAATEKQTGILRSELALWFGIATTLVFFTLGSGWLDDLSNTLKFALLFVWLFAIMLWLSFGVVRHADCLAILLGEPFGTLILTLSVIGIEVVMIAAVMVTGENVPTLARDTMFSVLMIVLNGMLGLTLLIGAWRHKEQEYNLAGARTYLGVIVPVAVLGLVLPRYTTSAPGGQVSLLLGTYLLIMSIGIYLVFLLIQTRRHAHYFCQPVAEDSDGSVNHHEGLQVRSPWHHALFLLLTMLPIVLLAKKMAALIDHGIVALSAPYALGGFLVAILVLAPEGMGAIRSALDNQLQRTVNIALGSALSTISLTIPAVLAISMITGRTIELGLGAVQLVFLILTLVVTLINFGGMRTNVMQGAVHLIIFISYVILIFD